MEIGKRVTLTKNGEICGVVWLKSIRTNVCDPGGGVEGNPKTQLAHSTERRFDRAVYQNVPSSSLSDLLPFKVEQLGTTRKQSTYSGLR